MAEGARAPLPRAIDVQAFALARQREIVALGNAASLVPDGSVQSSSASGRSTFRRRTGSFNSYTHVRRPNRKRQAARAAAATGGSGTPRPPPTNRSMRRKPSLLRARALDECRWRWEDLGSGEGAPGGAAGVSECEESRVAQVEPLPLQRSRRLETHVWHAKRMRMESCFGWTLPAGRAGAGLGDRAAVAALISGQGWVHDASYWCCFRVEGALDAVRAVLGTVVGDAEREKVVAWASGLAADSRGREMSVELRSLAVSGSTSERQCIGPAHVTLLPTQLPAGPFLALVWVHAAAARDAASTLQFACRGASLASLALADLRRVELRGRHSEGALQRALGVRCEDVPDEGVAIVSIRDPRFRVYHALSCLDARETGSTKLEPSSAAAFLSHPRASSETEASQKNAQARNRALGIAAEAEQPRPDLDAYASYCPVLCVRQGSWDAELLPGWSICLPAGWVSPFLSALVAAGMAVAGQQEWHWMHTARSVPFFPADFAGTSACQRYRDVAGSLDRSANLLLPRLKRRTLGQGLDWGAGRGSQVQRAMARPLKRGRLAELALLLVPPPPEPIIGCSETLVSCRPRRLHAADVKALCLKLGDSSAPLALTSEIELAAVGSADAPLRLRVAGQITSPAPRPYSAAVACVDGAMAAAGHFLALCWNPGSGVLVPVRLALI